MASGWAGDDAVFEQMTSSVSEAVERARGKLPRGVGSHQCLECGDAIPAARRQAIPGVTLCVACQAEQDRADAPAAAYNRRGSKDSQLR